MSPALAVLLGLVAVLAAIVLIVAVRACADVRIAAHTGQDPRVDVNREVDKRAVSSGMVTQRDRDLLRTGGEVVDRLGSPPAGVTGGSKD